MKIVAGMKTQSSGINRVELGIMDIVAKVYKKNGVNLKVKDLKKDVVDRREGVVNLKIADLTFTLVDDVITEINPSNTKEAKEVIKEIKSQSRIPYNF